MLKKHKYYVYCEENFVYARMDDQERVVLEECESPQAAADKVQSIVNPEGFSHEKFGVRGFHAKEFQDSLSDKCKQPVLDAYAKAGK